MTATRTATEEFLRAALETIANGELVVDCAAKEYAKGVLDDLEEVAALAVKREEQAYRLLQQAQTNLDAAYTFWLCCASDTEALKGVN